MALSCGYISVYIEALSCRHLSMYIEVSHVKVFSSTCPMLNIQAQIDTTGGVEGTMVRPWPVGAGRNFVRCLWGSLEKFRSPMVSRKFLTFIRTSLYFLFIFIFDIR